MKGSFLRGLSPTLTLRSFSVTLFALGSRLFLIQLQINTQKEFHFIKGNLGNISFHFNSFVRWGPTFHFISFHFVVKWILMSINEAVRELGLFIFLRHTRGRRRGRQGEGSVYWVQQTDTIETKPTVKIQSVSPDHRIQELPLDHVQLFKFPWLVMWRRSREEFLRLWACSRQEIRILVMLRMNRGSMEYMRRVTRTLHFSEFKEGDTYVRAHGPHWHPDLRLITYYET
jgi:hypothetical protein